MLKALAFATTLAATPVLAEYNAADFDTQCADLAGTLRTTYDNASIWFTQSVAAGTNVSLPDYDPDCGSQWQVVDVDICRVAMFVPTSDRSNISSTSPEKRSKLLAD